MNNAAAYTAWHQVCVCARACHLSALKADALSCRVAVAVQTMDSHTRWLSEFQNYLQRGQMLFDPPVVTGSARSCHLCCPFPAVLLSLTLTLSLSLSLSLHRVVSWPLRLHVYRMSQDTSTQRRPRA
jgi:hypothetical protein